MKFTTRDKDNDRWPTDNCANRVAVNSGGWWYNSCANIYLNNQYKHKYGVYLNRKYHSPSFIEMKMRPKNCT